MSTNPILWVSLVIILGTIAVWTVQFVRSRRSRGRGDGRGPWWEGPWDDPPQDR